MPNLSPQNQDALSRLKAEEPELEASLDDLLDDIQEAASEPEVAEPIETQIKNDILSLLANREDAPTEEDIGRWKAQYGDEAIQVLGLDKDNVYIYTHITLSQWEKIQSIMQQIQGTAQAANVEKQLRDRVIRSAVLWPPLPKDFFSRCRAGLPDTIYQLIMIHSYFLSPQQAMSLTIQL